MRIANEAEEVEDFHVENPRWFQNHGFLQYWFEYFVILAKFHPQWYSPYITDHSMPPRRKKRSHVEEGMRLIQQCPLCEAVYEPLEIKVLDEHDGKHLVHVTCRKCAHSVVALITNQSNGGMSSMGLITDAEPEDVLRFKKSEVVSWDDCLAWHNFLQEDQLLKETFHK